MRPRPATDQDVPRLIAMMIDFNRHEAIDWSPVTGEPALRRLLADPGLGKVLVLEDDAGAACGYAIVTWGYDLEWGGRDALLTDLWVEPGARDGGMGSAALAAVDALARAHGAKALHLTVRHDNPRAHALYEREGFRTLPRAFLTKRLG